MAGHLERDDFRIYLIKINGKIHDIDFEHTAKRKMIYESTGWPAISDLKRNTTVYLNPAETSGVQITFDNLTFTNLCI